MEDHQENNSSESSFEDLANLNESEMKEMKDQNPEKEKENDFMDILGNGQLTKTIIAPGRPETRPMSGDLCQISFAGRLDDGTIVEEADDMKIHVGDNEVCQGLDMAIALMNYGEKAELKVTSRFAYGELGLKNETEDKVIVPPNATITYTVELVNFDEEDLDGVKSFELRKSVGNRKRERGNFWFKRNEFNLAIQLYRKALEYLDENIDSHEVAPPTMTNSELQELLEQRMIVYNNLAAAQTKINANDAAMKSVETVLRCQPNNVKALYRKGKILDAQGQTNEAIAIFQKAATLDPENKSFQNELSKLILKRSREQRNEKNLYQKMLGQAQKMEQKQTSPTTKTIPMETSWKSWTYLLGSILIGVAGVAFYRYKF